MNVFTPKQFVHILTTDMDLVGLWQTAEHTEAHIVKEIKKTEYLEYI